MTVNRQPKGVPVGGRYATAAHDEPVGSLELTDQERWVLVSTEAVRQAVVYLADAEERVATSVEAAVGELVLRHCPDAVGVTFALRQQTDLVTRQTENRYMGIQGVYFADGHYVGRNETRADGSQDATDRRAAFLAFTSEANRYLSYSTMTRWAQIREVPAGPLPGADPSGRPYGFGGRVRDGRITTETSESGTGRYSVADTLHNDAWDRKHAPVTDQKVERP